MAVLDTVANEIVIRVVYDGSPEAGKTTSLRALAGSLAQPLVTPAESPTGRTLWFDWMDYVGGRFEGSRIRCQIVSVPGQRALAERRRHIVGGADVVVSVLDSSSGGIGSSLESLEELRRQLRALPAPQVGVVLQANKRDLPDAVALDEIRNALGGWSVGVVESVAADGTGIREAFVYAVRLALDRVRELINANALPTGSPDLATADELLAALRGCEVPAPTAVARDEGSVAATLLGDVLAAEQEAEQRVVVPHLGHRPRPPDANVPSGTIWPPVEGRAILYDVSQLGVEPHLLATGDWTMGLGSGWRIMSARDACFGTLDEGRAALIQWARLHAANLPAISSQRCIVLADTGDGSWRLWQIVRVEESLREQLQRALDEETPELVVLRLCQGCKLLLDTTARIARTPCDLACTLDTVGAHEGTGVYIGLMPSATEAATARPTIHTTGLLRTQLAPIVTMARAGHRADSVRAVLGRVPPAMHDSDAIMTTLISLFG